MSAKLQPISKLVDRAAIRLYAELSDDFNPIHLDPEFAARTPMRGIIAHGMLSLNVIWQSLRATLGRAAIAGMTLKVRFLKPVREDDTVTAGGLRRDDGTFDVWVKNQRDETVISGTVQMRSVG